MVGIELLEYSLETFLVVCCLSGEFRKKTVEVLREHEMEIEYSKYWGAYSFKINVKLHRETSSPPSVIWPSGRKYWCKNEERHREYDLPSYITPQGHKFWCKNGEEHREYDLPSNIYSSGKKRLV